ncbi:ribonuclease R [Floricoccus penangensis]|nr:ribonuclease R [Floricoccus penangensis]URZ88179.1 ribonuclease R [Floricoccus penangensis]
MNIRNKIKEYLFNSPDKSISIQDLAKDLELDKSEDFKEFIGVVALMESQHEIEFNDLGEVSLFKKLEVSKKTGIEGIFHANANGFGFVTIAPDEPDVFIPRGNTNFALDQDRVSLQIIKPANPLTGTSAEAKVIDVVERNLNHMVGQFVAFTKEQEEESDLIGYIISKNKKVPYNVYLSPKGLRPENGQIVKVEITHYIEKEFPDSMQGLVTEIIGNQDDKGIDVLEVLESMDIRSAFPQEVIDEANAVSDTVEPSDFMGRVDYRDQIIFTIDGEDAKDLDDAVHINILPNGNFELGVHIADVSHYVTNGSALDKEAYERGTSVYVTDRVVPMLPERLSNGICSLNPQVDRLTQSCVMEIDHQGKVVDYQISQSVIKTAERMTYTDVNKMINGDAETLERYADIAESVDHMKDLHEILVKMRHDRGSIDFDTEEAKIIVDSNGKPVNIVKRNRGVAEKLIESFMLIANETVASFFQDAELPFIYRIHEHPKADKLARFIDFASAFGVPIKGTAQKMSQKDLQNFMLKIKGKPGDAVLSTMLLRSMQQARYDDKNEGHYGLAAENYTHFTSPIRRYPDLIVHRLIREMAHPDKKTVDYWAEKIPEIAKHSSEMERRAVDAEREVEKMKKAEYMEQFVGQDFTGVISSVTTFGFFVELPNTIEGLVHIKTLDGEYFNYLERTMTLQGEKTGLTFKVGQEVKVNLVRSDRQTGDIDFIHIPSELDLVEKRSKSKPNSRRSKDKDAKHGDSNGRDRKSSDKKNEKKPFYKKVAKNSQKGGKRSGKGSRKRSRSK